MEGIKINYIEFDMPLSVRNFLEDKYMHLLIMVKQKKKQ